MVLQRFEGDPPHGPSAKFSPDGKWIVGEYSKFELLHFWDFKQAIETKSQSPPPPTHIVDMQGCWANDIAFSSDGSLLMAACADAGKFFWVDLRAGDLSAAFHVAENGRTDLGNPGQILVSRDNNFALTYGRGGFVVKWTRNASGSFDFSVPWETDEVGKRMYVDDSFRRAVLWAGDGTARVFDLNNLSRPFLNLSHPPGVSDVDISHDGNYAVTCSANSIRIWNLDPRSAVKQARRQVGHSMTPSERQEYLDLDIEPISIADR